MKKITLAQELRQRQLAQGIVSESIINELSDDEIIDAYITCSGCGEKQVPARELGTVIALATDANHFFELCDRWEHPHR
jgi:hypothetical protein